MSKLYGIILFFCIAGLTVQAQDPLRVDFRPSNLNPAPGSQVEIDVVVSDWDNIAGAQFGILWDSLVLSYNSVTNVTTDLPELIFDESVGAVSSISTPVNQANGFDGFIFFSWSRLSTEPFTLPDETRLFTIVLDAVGQPCDETSLFTGDDPNNVFRIIEIFDGNFDFVELESNTLDFVLEGPGCGGGMGGDSLIAYLGGDFDACFEEQFCFPIRVENFADVIAFQGSIQFDTNALKFDTVLTNLSIPNFSGSNFNLTGVDTAGRAAWIWTDITTVTPLNFADSTTLIEFCFEVLAPLGSSTNISYVDTPTAVDFTNSNSQPIDFGIENATTNFVDTNCGVVEPEKKFSICADSVDVNMELGEVCVDYTVAGFDSIGLFQFNIFWDETVMLFKEMIAPPTNPINFQNSNINVISPNQLRVSWSSQSGAASGVSVPCGTLVFTLCFDLEGSCESETDLRFDSDAGVGIEIAKGDDTIITDYELKDGYVKIECGFTVDCEITNPTCTGDLNGVILCDIFGGMPPFECVWRTVGAQTVSTDCNLLGQGAGTYSLEITDANGQELDTTFTLLDPPLIELSGEITDGDCSVGGSIDLTCIGGTGTLTCNWSGPGDPIPSGTKNPMDLIEGVYSVTCTDSNGCSSIAEFMVNVAGGGETVSIEVIKDADCSSGGILEVTTNVSNPIYVWDPSFVTGPNPNNLPAGNYSVTVTDGVTGCSATANAEIMQMGALEVTGEKTDVDCDNLGAISLTITGSTIPQPNIVWSDGMGADLDMRTGLDVGNYDVTVTDIETGCSDVASFEIISTIEPITISLNLIDNQITCLGGDDASAEVTITGGCNPQCTITDPNPGLDYSCDDLSNLTCGVYTINVVDDNGNTASDSFVITCPSEALSGTIMPLDSACVDTTGTLVVSPTAVLTASGGYGQPYTFMWTNLSDMSTDMTTSDTLVLDTFCYEIKVIDPAGCEHIIDEMFCPPVKRDDPPPPPLPDSLSVNFGSVTSDFNGFDVSCEGDCNGEDTIDITSGEAPFVIDVDGVMINQATIADDILLTGLCGGSNAVTVTDSEGQDTTFSIILTEPNAILITLDSDTCAIAGMNNAFITIDVESEVSGLVYDWVSGGDGVTLDSISAGNYVVSVTNANGCSASEVFTVEPCVEPPIIETCFEGRSVITPNGDGANEFFIFANCSEDVICLNLYDRYGEEVYFSANYQNEWNGLDSAGAELPEGPYFYVVSRKRENDQDVVYKGTVTLLR